MKIASLFWDGCAYGATDWPGLAVKQWASGLSSLGHDVHVFTRGPYGEARQEKVDGVVFHILPDPKETDPLECSARAAEILVSALEKHEQEDGMFDLVHAHGWMCIPAVIKIAVRGRRRTVLTLFSIEPFRSRSDISGEASMVVRALEQGAVESCDRVLVLEDVLRENLINAYGAVPERVETILSGFDDSRFQEQVNVNDVKASQGIGTGEDLVLFVGELNKSSGTELLLDALPQVIAARSQARTVFVGHGELYWTLKVRSHYLNIEHAVRFPGHLEGRQVYDLIKAADVVVVPGTLKRSELIILCAGASGIPVVATEGFDSNIIRDRFNGLVAESNVDALAQALITCLDDKELAKTMGMAGQDNISKRFSWNRAAELLSKVYSSIDSPG